MKKKKREGFSEQLKERIRALKLKEGDVHVFNIHAEYGNYQVIVGGEEGMHEKGEDGIEIKGEVHHLFLSDKGLQVIPTREQVGNNLKGMLVLRALQVHLKDSAGDGEHLDARVHDVDPKEIINLAGDSGENMMKKAMAESQFYEQAYKIIQMDILNSLKRKNEEKEVTFED